MKSFIKVFLVTSLMVSFGLSNQSLDTRKEKILNKIDKRIELLNILKGCVTEAKERDDLKECRKSHKSALERLKAESRKYIEQHK